MAAQSFCSSGRLGKDQRRVKNCDVCASSTPTPLPPVIPPTESEHDEHEENRAEASAELSSEG